MLKNQHFVYIAVHAQFYYTKQTIFSFIHRKEWCKGTMMIKLFKQKYEKEKEA